MYAQETAMGVSGLHFGAGYGGAGERMMIGRGASASAGGVQERMMLGSEYGHGGMAHYPYPAAQSGRRSRAGGSARRRDATAGGMSQSRSDQTRSRNDQTRRPLAPRLDVPVSRGGGRAPPSSYASASGVQGFLDPLEGLGGLGMFF